MLLASMLLSLSPPVFAEGALTPGPLLRVLATEGIGGGPTGDNVDLSNAGGAPLALKVGGDPRILPSKTSISVPAGAVFPLHLQFKGSCPDFDSSGPSTCGSGTLELSGPGGSLRVEVTVYPPNIGVLGSMPPRLYWDPSGPPPPAIPRGLGSGSQDSPSLDGTSRRVQAAHGPIELRVSRLSLFDTSLLSALEASLEAAALACDAAESGERSRWSAEMELGASWNAQGRLTGLSVSGHLGGEQERCLVGRLLATPAPGGSGRAFFRLSHPNEPAK